jgi:hypothetical protein
MVLAGAIWFLAAISYDRIVRWQYAHRHKEWELDGRPDGIFWRPEDAVFWKSDNAKKKMMWTWLLHTPPWAEEMKHDRRFFILYRSAACLWMIGVVSLMLFLAHL